jgi:hypothetical protein
MRIIWEHVKELKSGEKGGGWDFVKIGTLLKDSTHHHKILI